MLAEVTSIDCINCRQQLNRVQSKPGSGKTAVAKRRSLLKRVIVKASRRRARSPSRVLDRLSRAYTKLVFHSPERHRQVTAEPSRPVQSHYTGIRCAINEIDPGFDPSPSVSWLIPLSPLESSFASLTLTADQGEHAKVPRARATRDQ